MLSKQDEAFVAFWSKNREQEKTSMRPFLVGMSAGLAVGVLVLVVLSSGWYERANMVANTRFSMAIFILAILILSFFMAFLYRRFRWEMQEQRYLELIAKKEKHEKTAQKQP
jgi:uncharacterized membrane protein